MCVKGIQSRITRKSYFTEYHFKAVLLWGLSDRIDSRYALALHAGKLGSIPSIAYGLRVMPRVIPEHRTKFKPRALLGMHHQHYHKNKNNTFFLIRVGNTKDL